MIFFNNISKPWVNYYVNTIIYDGDRYQEINIRNTSDDINKQSKIEIPVDYLDDFEKLTENIDVRGAKYLIKDNFIEVYLGSEGYFNMSCINCDIDESIIRNINSEDFSLRSCDSDKTHCLYQSKFDYYVDKAFSYYFMILSPLLIIYWIFIFFKNK